MFAVISCNKYSHRSIRVIDFGDKDIAERIRSLPPMECAVCGPFCHTELSWGPYWVVESTHDLQDEAISARRALIETKPMLYRAD